MAANLLHMEEIAFPSKMCFSSCLSCTGDDESQHALPCFVSAYSFLSLQGRETANRHQRREQALIISCSGLLFPFSCYFNLLSFICDLFVPSEIYL